MQFVAQKQVYAWQKAREEEEIKGKRKMNFFSSSSSLIISSKNESETLDKKSKMAKALHLSKLSRGHVELSENGSRLEIFADQTVCLFL